MQIVIDISEKEMKMVKDSNKAVFIDVYKMMAQKIQKGTPLPEHGRLIDADALIFNADYYEPLISKRDVDFAPTIIERSEQNADSD